MTRRHFIQGLAGAAALGSRRGASKPPHPDATAVVQPPSSLPGSVAGVRLIDSKVARSAYRLCRSAYPLYLLNHAMRTYIFGSLLGLAKGQRLDQETLYLGCLLHDLGLTSRFEGDLPFEIQGAQAAREFLRSEGVPKETIALVWDGIALHPSPVSDFKPPEIALVGAGAGADVLGGDLSKIPPERVAETLKAFPRLHFKSAFLKSCADVVRRHPAAATRGFMRDVGERLVPGFHPPNFCDRVERAPFAD